MRESEFDPLGVELVNIERAWHPMAKSAGDENGIVDIDVSPDFDNPYEFSNEAEVQAALIRLEIEAKEIDSAQNVDFIRDKIRAHLMHLRVGSGEVSLDEHVGAAMGTKPEMVDEDILDRHRNALDAQLRDAPTGPALRYDLESRADLKQELIIPDPELARRELMISNDHSTGFILRKTGIQPVYIEPEIVEEDVEWSGYLGTEEKEFFYKTNIHPRHEYTLGRIWANSPHERTHITQFGGVYKDAILRGDMSVSTGVTSFHAPENTQAEFNAQAVEQMALRELGASGREDAWQFRFQADYHYYAEMVWNNAHIMINSGAEEQEVVRYIEERLLLDTHENVAGAVPVRRDDPTIRGYFGGAYWPSLVVGMEMIKPGHLTDPGGEQPEPEDLQSVQRSVLGLTMSRPVKLDEIKDKITESV
jgi:hypothetical protein